MKRGLAGLLVASAISLLGSRMSLVALPWFVLVSTGSGAKTGIVAAAEMLPYVIACGLGGPLLDRIGYRKASIVADLASAVAVLAIALLGLNFGLLVGLVAVAGGLRGFGDTAKRVLFRQAVAESGVDITRAGSVNDGINRLATLLGAPLASVLIVVWDAPAVIMLDAATFLLGGMVVAALVPLLSPPPAQPAYLTALREGFGFLRRDRLITGLLLVFFVSNLLDSAYGSVLIPLWAKDIVGSPIALGLASAAFAIGAVLGNVVFTAIAPRVPRFATYAVGFIIGGAPRFLVAGLTDDPLPMYVVCFVAGLGMAAVNPIIGAVMFERVPADMQARVQGVATAIAWGGIPVGALIGGWLSEWHLPAALISLGLCYLLLTLLPFTRPIWREIDLKPGAAIGAGA